MTRRTTTDEKRTLLTLQDLARAIRDAISQGRSPRMQVPVRSLSNVIYDEVAGYLRIGDSYKIRELTATTARTFAQTLRLMAVSKEIVETGDFATKREAYYISKNWADCRFDGQPESDAILDDIEAMLASRGIFREQLGFHPEERGGSVAGVLIVVETDRETGREHRVDCTAFGTGAYSIPHHVEELEFITDAAFILAVETGGMFQRLNAHKFWSRQNSILVELAGVPTRATRRFIRRLSDACDLPVYGFVDCDPYGIANIYRTLKVGSGNAAHVNEHFCVPRARFLGVTPQDIEDFGLEDATHPLQAVDVKRARDALDHDPFFAAHPSWKQALEQMLSMGVRAEQQALAKWGLNYVIQDYLPRKLADPSLFLP